MNIEITDPTFLPKRKHHLLDRFLLRLIADERDLVFVHLVIWLSLLVIPVAVFLYLPGMFTWWVAAPYLVVVLLVFLGPYILMLHCTCHRRLFRSRYNWMNKIIPWLLGPFFGETPETYYGHHMGMHHPENNLEDDLSSTMRYQRDSFVHFIIYFLRFFFFVLPELSVYFSRRKRKKLMGRTIAGELVWIAAIVLLAIWNFQATLAVFIIPLVFTRFMMMAGNWGQHAFIDAAAPGNCYRNSVTCINSVYNRRCFNDGYHIVHHLRPSLHYTDMPGEFISNLKVYAKEKALVFKGIDFFMIWFLLMTRSYKTLARRVVVLDEEGKSQQEIIELLRARTRRIR